MTALTIRVDGPGVIRPRHKPLERWTRCPVCHGPHTLTARVLGPGADDGIVTGCAAGCGMERIAARLEGRPIPLPQSEPMPEGVDLQDIARRLLVEVRANEDRDWLVPEDLRRVAPNVPMSRFSDVLRLMPEVVQDASWSKAFAFSAERAAGALAEQFDEGRDAAFYDELSALSEADYWARIEAIREQEDQGAITGVHPEYGVRPPYKPRVPGQSKMTPPAPIRRSSWFVPTQQLDRERLIERLKAVPPAEWVAHLFPDRHVRGRKFLCPFHDERTPSCNVGSRQIHCFGCGRSADVIDAAGFVWGYGVQPRGRDFNEVIDRLADELLGGAR